MPTHIEPILIKRGAGAPPSLAQGELALDLTNGILYAGIGSPPVVTPITVKDLLLPQTKLTAAKAYTTEATFTIPHDNADTVLLTSGGAHTSSLTTPVEIGTRAGQTLTILRVSGAHTVTLKSVTARTVLRGDWVTNTVGGWLRLCWDAANAKWYEVGRSLTAGTNAGTYAVAEGAGTAGGYAAHAEGNVTTASGNSAHAEGSECVATGNYSHSEGDRARARLTGQHAHASISYGVVGDCQNTRFQLRGETSNAFGHVLELTAPTRFTLLNDYAYACTITVFGRRKRSEGNEHAMYKRMCIIRHNAGTVALAPSDLPTDVKTIGTDIESDTDWDVTITADNTNKSLKVVVTGKADMTIRWTALIETVEIGYA